jgi:hypothetical protein
MAFDEGDATAASRGRMKERGHKWKKRGDQLFVEKDSFNALFQAQAEIFYPERADFFGDRAYGDERYDGIFTSVPQRMRRDMANNLGAMLRPRGKEWFKCVVRPERLMEPKLHKQWLEKTTRTQRNIVYAPPANFTRAMAESDNDYACFGNAVIRHTYNQDRSGLLFSCAHLKDCAWSENHEGVVDELHERMNLTLKQAASLFGKDNLPKEWRDKCDDHPEQKVKVQRCVAPLELYEYEKGEKPRKNAKYLSIYMACEVDEKEAGLGEGYFNWFPYLVRRWMTVSGEPYGRSPCAGVALADARTLNVAQQALLKSVEWRVDPPKVAAHDAIVGEINLRAGAITYYSPEAMGDTGNRKVIENLESGDPRFGIDLTDRLAMTLGRAFFQDLMKLPEKTMTAYEAGKWIEEYVRSAAPVFEPMEAENATLMDGVFERAMEKGAFDEAPEGLQGAEVNFEFETPLSDAYRDLKAQQASQLVTDMTLQVEIAPDSIDNVDWDEVTRGRMQNLPTDWARDPELVKQMRDTRAEAQAEEQGKQEMAVAADMALKAKPENLKMMDDAMQRGAA